MFWKPSAKTLTPICKPICDIAFPYASVAPLAHVFVKHAPERLVWGLDWPHVNLDGREMPNDGDLLDLMTEWVLDGAVRDRILAQNAKTLYGFE